MFHLADFCNRIKILSDRVTVKEEIFRLTLSGRNFDATIIDSIKDIWAAGSALGIAPPDVHFGGDSLGIDDVDDLTTFTGSAWEFRIGKENLVSKLAARVDGATYFFFSVNGFVSWCATLDPFKRDTILEPDFNQLITIRVAGLRTSFGGPALWILPLEGEAEGIKNVKLPDSVAVHSQIHIQTDSSPLVVCPRGISLTWGAISCAAGTALMQKSAWVLAASLVQDLKRNRGLYEVTLRGTKRVDAALQLPTDLPVTPLFLELLTVVVAWVYEERSETRLKLIMDRLSIDMVPGQSLLDGMREALSDAFQQAKDSYTFVIMERKDAYHKELRELLKDMRTQADLYAAKVRDLINSLTRDIVAVMALIGFSFLGKFDSTTLKAGLSSREFGWLSAVLSGYLILSFALQSIAYLRDVNLSFNEGQSWLKILQNYTARSENDERFTAPIKRRRRTLYVAMGIIGVIYVALAISILYIPEIIGALSLRTT
jgi:hypothetical protein